MNNNITELKQRAYGRWHQILSHTAPTLEPAIQKAGRHVPCPVHGGKDGFRLFNDSNETGASICNTCGANSDGFATLMFANECSFSEARRLVESFLGCQAPAAQTRKLSPTVKKNAVRHTLSAKNHRFLEDLLSKCLPLLPTPQPAAKYLEIRGISMPNAFRDLLFHPACEYWENRMCALFPALIAIIRDQYGTPVGIHRTYLDPDGGKANVNAPKKCKAFAQGSTTGGAVKLYPPTELLGVAEGIETTLALRSQINMPLWACLSANGLASVVIPSDVKKLFIFADKDLSLTGESAALKLARRHPFIHCQIIKPTQDIITGTKSVDWADVIAGGQS